MTKWLMVSESSAVMKFSMSLITSGDNWGNSSWMIAILYCCVRTGGSDLRQLNSLAMVEKEYREISQHNFWSVVIFSSFALGKVKRSTSDKDLNDSWTFLEDVLCLFASDSSSSNRGSNLFFLDAMAYLCRTGRGPAPTVQFGEYSKGIAHLAVKLRRQQTRHF